MVVVRLLGPVDVIDGSDAVHAPDSALRRTLLALLAMRAGEVLATDWLLEHAWGGAPPESGSAALRFHISRLRRELGDDSLIETCPGGYRLAVTADQVDALAVEERSQAARSERDSARAADTYAEVLAMWRGAPFVDAASCPLLDDEAGRLSELRLAITEDHLQARLDAGAGRELVADLSRATRQHPLRESLWSMLITAQYRAGMQADALRSFEQMREVLTDGLGLDPSNELQDLQRRVLQHDPALLADGVVEQSAKSQGNLPDIAALFVGRSDELQRYVVQLANYRLLTLTGPGGVGKTRLAIETASLVAEQFRGGTWLVELARVAEPNAVVSVLASLFSIQTRPDMSWLESIVEWLQGREMLLVLDNCEHVLDAASELVEAIVTQCPSVVVLATSREPLGVPGEQVHPLAPLSQAEAVDLFVDRAGAADATFVATQADSATLAEICQRLDCLPLAIELAAARIRSTSPDDLLARLIDRVPLSWNGGRESSRHHTLRATVAWSYQLLTDAEQKVFDRTSVFAGAFDLDAATAVCADDSIERVDVVGVLDSLVDKSILVAVRSARSVHFRVLEILRQYGEERLEERAETVATRDRHLAHYIAVARRARDLWVSVRQVEGAAMFDAAWDNLRRAHAWAIETKDTAAADAIIALSGEHASARVWYEHGNWAMRTISLETVERHPHPDTFCWAAIWTGSDGDEEAALTLLSRAIDSAPAADHPDTAFSWTIMSAMLCIGFGRMGEAQHAAEQAEIAAADHPDRLARWGAINARAIVSIATDDALVDDYVVRLTAATKELGAPILIARAATIEGYSRFRAPGTGGLHEAMICFQRSAEIARAMGDVRIEGESLVGIAIASTALNSASASEDCVAALTNLHEARNWQPIWRLADPLAKWLASSGHTDVAAVIYGFLGANQAPGPAGFIEMRSRGIERVRRVDNADDLLAIGAEMNRDQLIEYILAQLEHEKFNAP